MDWFVDRIEAWRGERPRASIRVLDIGCGNGNITLPLGGIGYQTTGVDLDGASIARAQRAMEDVPNAQLRFLEGSFERVQDETFDIVIASEVLEHQEDPVAFLADVRARLAPGGLFLISVPNGKGLEERIRRFTTKTSIGRRLKGWIKRGLRDTVVQTEAMHPHAQYLGYRAWIELLRGDGWHVRSAAQAAAWFKEWFYLGGRFLLKRGSKLFHTLDASDGAFAPHLPMSWADGWLFSLAPAGAGRPLVMHVLPTLEAGGAERLVFEIASKLPHEGQDARVVSILRGGPLEATFQEAKIPYVILGRRGLAGIAACRALVRIMQRERPDIVHTHLYGVADVWGRLAARIAGVPVIISTEHNVNPDHGAIKRLVKRALAPITTAFVAVSNEVKTYMTVAEHLPAAKIHVILNGIDMSRIRVRPVRTARDVPQILTVGRLVPQKGHAVLLKALALVKGPWMLKIVGSGPREGELRQLAERLAIAPRVHWLGYRTDVPELLVDADVFCFPSRWEGLGLGFLEAAAAATPIIASDLPVFHEVLSSDEASYVTVGDVPAFAHAIEARLCRSQRCGTACVARRGSCPIAFHHRSNGLGIRAVVSRPPRDKEKKRMKILHVNKFFDLHGGAEGYMHRLMAKQEADGHEVHVFSTRAPDNLPTKDASYFVPRFDYTRKEGVGRDVVKAAAFLWNRDARRAMESLLDDLRPDVVHLHNVYHHLSTSVLEPVRRRRIPCVQTLHDYKLACPNYKMYTEGSVCERCKGGRYLEAVAHHCLFPSMAGNLLAAAEMGLTKLMRSYERTVQTFIAPSQFMADKMVAWGEPPSKFRVIPNPVEAPQESAPRGGGYLLYAGRLSQEKGVDVLVRAAAAVPELSLQIAGIGPEEARLKQLVETAGASHITFVGFKRKDDLAALRRNAEALVVPSVWYENAPLAVLEAMADGLPIIASRIGGLPELVREGVNGSLVDPGDVDALVRALRRFNGLNASDRAQMAGESRAAAIEQYGWDRHLSAIMETYADAAQSRARKH